MEFKGRIENYLSIFENVPTAICIVDTEMKYLVASEKWKLDYGIQDKEIIGVSHYEIFPEIGEEWKNLHKRALKGEILKSDEDKFERLDGTFQYIKWEIKPWYDDNNQIGGLYMYTDDLTLFKEKTVLIENFFNISNDIFLVANYEGKFLQINKVWEKLLGYTTQEIYEKNYFDLIHPDDIESTIEALKVLGDGELVENYVNRYKTKSGEYRTLNWRCFPYNNYVYATARDITNEIITQNKLKENEERLRVSLEGSLYAVCFLEALYENSEIVDFIIKDINSQASKYLNKTKDELINQKYFALFPENKINGFFEKYKNTFLTQKLFEEEIHLPNNNVDSDWFYQQIIPMKNGVTVFINDISTQKHSIIELEKTKKLLENINNIAKIGIWEVDLINNSINWSDITKKIHGVDQDYIPDLNSGINFYKEGYSRDKIKELVNIAIMQGKSWDTELELTNILGEDVWVRAIGNVEFIDNKPIKLYGTFQDITYRKVLEVSMDEDKERLNQIIEGTNVGTWEWNVQTGETTFNERWANIIGYTLEELEPIDINTWIKFSHPDDLKLSEEALKLHFSGESPFYECIVRMYHKNGNLVWVQDKGKLFSRTEDGKPLKMYGTHQDITEQMELQDKIIELNDSLTSIMNSTTQVSIITTDLNGVITLFNKGAENLLGYKASEMIGHKTPQILHLESEVISRSIELSNEFGREIIGFDVFIEKAKHGEFDSNDWTYVRKDGTYFPINLIITAQKNNKGEIVGFIGIATDISKVKKYELELISARLKAEESSKTKSDFLANMSHEIRTPLNGVIGFSDLLLRTKLDDIQQQYMETVNKSGTLLLDLINDILDFSKIEAGKLELYIEKVDLFELAGQVVDVVKFNAHKKNLEVLLNIDLEIDRFIYTDQVRLRQILVNLLSNAIKFTEKGEVELKIKRKSVKLESGQKYAEIIFSVRDTGIGIAESNFKKILDVFSQEDTSTTRKYGGTGLGLTITKKLLDLFDSQIEISSELGKGSIFNFKLDVITEVGELETWENQHNIKRTLVIDDNANNRIIIRDILKLQDIQCDEASNGIEALSKIENNENYDLIIVDYIMPYMDGLEVIKNIRENIGLDENHQPIIFLHSSSENEKITLASDKLKINHKMLKPVKVDWLFKAINQIKKNEIRDSNQDLNKVYSNISKSNESILNVLIVEDNAVNLFLAKSIFNIILPNANIIEAKNGKEAVEMVMIIVPDIIFMDIQMPVMNGYEASIQIRSLSNAKDVPIIALTAGTVKDEKERCLEAGMNDYITKPIIADTINTVLAKWTSHLDKTQKQNELDLNEFHFNEKKLLERLLNDKETLLILTSLFHDFLKNDFISNFNSYVNDNNILDLKFIMHKIKGTAATTCTNNLFNISSDIEKFLVSNSNLKDDTFVNLQKSLLEEVDIVINILQKYN